MQKKNKIITFEGLDGVGKTEALRAIENHARMNHVPLIVVRNPGFSKLAEQLSYIVKFQCSPESSTALSLTFLAGLIENQEKINSMTQDGRIILQDRSALSNFAYSEFTIGQYNSLLGTLGYLTKDFLGDAVFYIEKEDRLNDCVDLLESKANWNKVSKNYTEILDSINVPVVRWTNDFPSIREWRNHATTEMYSHIIDKI